MQPATPVTLFNQTFLLSVLRGMYWQEASTLLVADLHLGKTGHFRKAGIAVPQQLYQEDLHRLFSMIQYFKPQRLLILGDMIHSAANRELDLFARWRSDHQQLHVALVRGNHDSLDAGWFHEQSIEVHSSYLEEGDFLFLHDRTQHPEMQAGYRISGHIHPGYTINGAGKQALHFPCFFIGKQDTVLPAFSLFSGTHSIKPKKGDQVFALVEDRTNEPQLMQVYPG